MPHASQGPRHVCAHAHFSRVRGSRLEHSHSQTFSYGCLKNITQSTTRHDSQTADSAPVVSRFSASSTSLLVSPTQPGGTCLADLLNHLPLRPLDTFSFFDLDRATFRGTVFSNDQTWVNIHERRLRSRRRPLFQTGSTLKVRDLVFASI